MLDQNDPRKAHNLLRDHAKTWACFLLACAIGAPIGYVVGSVIAAVIA